MITPISYSLEDVETTYHPNRPMRPVICDDCRNALENTPAMRINWNSFHALKRSTYHYQVLDYYGAGTHGCTCCGSKQYSGRWLVEQRRK